jgi:hypothetical protein
VCNSEKYFHTLSRGFGVVKWTQETPRPIIFGHNFILIGFRRADIVNRD